MNVMSVIRLLPESNDQVSKFSNELKDTLDSGDVNPLDILLCIKGFEKMVKNIKEYLNQLAVDELSKYSEKDIEYKTAKLSVVEAGVKYDYSNCNDFEIAKYAISTLELKAKIESRQNFLKGIKGSVNIINEETGEIIEIFQPIRTSTTTAKVTLK